MQHQQRQQQPACQQRAVPGQPPRQYTRIKVLSAGNSGVGKSCLIKRFCEEKFVPRYISTIGVDFGVREVALPTRAAAADTRKTQPTLKVNFFDLSGNHDYIDVRKEFYKDTSVLLLVFDVGDKRSFQDLNSWINEAKSHGCDTNHVFVCGNKSDRDANNRQVSEHEATRWAATKGFRYMETSAQSGQNVAAAFRSIFEACTAKVQLKR